MDKQQHTPKPWVAVEVGQGGPADNPMPIYEIRSADGRAVVAEYLSEADAKHIVQCVNGQIERRLSREADEAARAIAAEARWMERNEQDGVPYGTY